MSVSTLLPSLKELNRSEKLHVIEYLLEELNSKKNFGFHPNLAYPVWSPFNSFEAANTMLDLLKNAQK